MTMCIASPWEHLLLTGSYQNWNLSIKIFFSNVLKTLLMINAHETSFISHQRESKLCRVIFFPSFTPRACQRLRILKSGLLSRFLSGSRLNFLVIRREKEVLKFKPGRSDKAIFAATHWWVETFYCKPSREVCATTRKCDLKAPKTNQSACRSKDLCEECNRNLKSAFKAWEEWIVWEVLILVSWQVQWSSW